MMTEKIREIAIDELRIPEYSQRVNYDWVDHIVKHFDPNLVNPLMVSERDGKYYVFGGQHTLEAMRVLRRKNALCRVFTGLTLQEEMQLRYSGGKQKGGRIEGKRNRTVSRPGSKGIRRALS